jgi:hypothetical protein
MSGMKDSFQDNYNRGDDMKLKVTYDKYNVHYQHIRNKFFVKTPWSTALRQKPTVTRLVKKFPTFNGTRKFSTVFINRPSPVPVLRQISPSRAPHPVLEDSFNITLPSTTRCPNGLSPSRFPTKNPYAPLPHTHYMLHPPHPS